MDAAEESRPADAEGRPEITLKHLFDDRSDPSELTIFSPTPRNLATEWVTADRETAVGLDEMR
jgi:hypothetical protein